MLVLWPSYLADGVQRSCGSLTSVVMNCTVVSNVSAIAHVSHSNMAWL